MYRDLSDTDLRREFARLELAVAMSVADVRGSMPRALADRWCAIKDEYERRGWDHGR